jgi:hypothetical protein
MRITGRVGMMLSATALMTLILGTAPAAAQTPAPPAPREKAPAPPQEKAKAAPAQIKGELVSVNATAKTITVAGADGKDMVFAYNEATVVSGAKEGVAGLATMTRSQVTVHFTE